MKKGLVKFISFFDGVDLSPELQTTIIQAIQ